MIYVRIVQSLSKASFLARRSGQLLKIRVASDSVAPTSIWIGCERCTKEVGNATYIFCD